MILLIAVGNAACAQSEWELSKNKNGIKVYTRKTDSSDFKAVKQSSYGEYSKFITGALVLGVSLFTYYQLNKEGAQVGDVNAFMPKL